MWCAGSYDTGTEYKEIIAENVDGYLVLDETIYYAQEGKIHTTTSGTETELSEGGYQVKSKEMHVIL